MDLLPLRYVYGTELTFHSHLMAQLTKVKSWRYLRAAHARMYAQGDAFVAQLHEHFPTARHVWDCDATLEIHSPLLRNWKSFETFYRTTCALAKTFKFPIKAPGWSTGGGHLHVSGGKTRHSKLRNFIRADRGGRPYLNWVFNDPEDNSVIHPSLTQWYRNRDMWKRHAITCRYRTIEFRLFEMPRNWDEQVLHILFCEHYLDWVTARAEAGASPSSTLYPEEAKTFDKAKGHFNDFLRQLNLDPYPFQIFVDCNLRARFSPGFDLSF